MDQNFSSDSRKRVSENSKLIQKTDLAALARFFDSPLNFRRPFSGKSRRPYIGKDPIPSLLIAPRASSLPSPLSSPSPSPYPFPSYRSLWVGPGQCYFFVPFGYDFVPNSADQKYAGYDFLKIVPTQNRFWYDFFLENDDFDTVSAKNHLKTELFLFFSACGANFEIRGTFNNGIA